MEPTTIYVYGEIAKDDLSAKDIATQLRGVTGEVTLRVNSPGGWTTEAATIIALLNDARRRGVRVTAIIDGACYSAASWIVAAATDRVLIAPDAMIMMHDPGIDYSGQAPDLRRAADLLDRVAGIMADDYARHLGITVVEAQALMVATTWFTADEAIAAGFAHELDTAPITLAARFEPEAYGFAGKTSITSLSEAFWARRGRPVRPSIAATQAGETFHDDIMRAWNTRKAVRW